MRRSIRIACVIICSGLAACCTAPTDKTPDAGISRSQKASPATVPTFPKLDVWLAESRLVINTAQPGVVEYNEAFAQGAALAYGEGYPVTEAEGAGQKRLTAIRAAEVVAQRNLAEYFARHTIDGELKFSSYTTRLEAFLKGAYVVASEYNADLEKAAVLIKLDLKGAKGFAK
ncbi:MAG: hypothetical protein WCP20_15535 [Desulfuromonadales bacterium]